MSKRASPYVLKWLGKDGMSHSKHESIKSGRQRLDCLTDWPLASQALIKIDWRWRERGGDCNLGNQVWWDWDLESSWRGRALYSIQLQHLMFVSNNCIVLPSVLQMRTNTLCPPFTSHTLIKVNTWTPWIVPLPLLDTEGQIWTLNHLIQIIPGTSIRPPSQST